MEEEEEGWEEAEEEEEYLGEIKERKFYKYGKENDIEGAKRAIEKGIDIHSTNYWKQTALHLSLFYKHFQFAYFLINNTNIDIEKIDNFGKTPLMCLLSFPDIKNKKFVKSVSKEEIFKFAIYFIEERNLKPIGKNERGESIFEVSILNYQYKVSKYLIEKNYFSIKENVLKKFNNRYTNILFLSMKRRVDEEFLIYLDDKGANGDLFFFLEYSIHCKYYSFATHLYSKYFFISNQLLNFDLPKLNSQLYFYRSSPSLSSSSKSPFSCSHSTSNSLIQFSFYNSNNNNNNNNENNLNNNNNNNNNRNIPIKKRKRRGSEFKWNINLIHLHFVHDILQQLKRENKEEKNDTENNLSDYFDYLKTIDNFIDLIRYLNDVKYDTEIQKISLILKLVKEKQFHFARRLIDLFSIPIHLLELSNDTQKQIFKV